MLISTDFIVIPLSPQGADGAGGSQVWKLLKRPRMIRGNIAAITAYRTFDQLPVRVSHRHIILEAVSARQAEDAIRNRFTTRCY